MKQLEAVFIYVVVSVINANRGDKLNVAEISHYENWMSFGRQITLDDCYQIYDQTEEVSPFTCTRKINPERNTCIDYTSNGNPCLILKTPTNESIELLCDETFRGEEKKDLIYHFLHTEALCFNVTKSERQIETRCIEKFENYSIGITTPDNYTILLDSYYCDARTTIRDRDSYNEFTNYFSFQPELRSCYKIYNYDQEPTPYTCFSNEVYDSCIQLLPHYNNCYGIVTQKNETIILHCPRNEKSNTNCFKIYDANGNAHTSCIEKVEERCVGFITPSNLTVLVECYFCSEPKKYNYKWDIKKFFYDPQQQRKYRKFIETYLKDEYLGKNSHLNNTHFLVFNQKGLVRPRIKCDEKGVDGYWIPNTNCYGITLDNNETVLLECVGIKSGIEPGCYKVIDSQQKEYTRCVEILDERCTGIITPGNLSVVLACYEERNSCMSGVEKAKNYFLQYSVDLVELFPSLHNCYQIYRENEVLGTNFCTKSAHPESYSCIDWIPGRKDYCLGLKTPANETIEILCGKSKEEVSSSEDGKYCFNVSSPDGNIDRRCIKKFDDYTLGITTPSNYSIATNSYFCKPFKTPQDIKEFKSFVSKFALNSDTRSCYKIYNEGQNVSPNNCLDKEIYESCVHHIPGTNCMGITTQYNETVILSCSTTEDKMPVDGCFKIYTGDNKVRVSCQEKLEESCVGIIAPSKLKILFECLTCRSPQGESVPYYDSELRKQYRPFVEKALQVYTKKYSFSEGEKFPISKPDQGIKVVDCDAEISIYQVQKLHGYNNCLGITMENFETIVLECPDKQTEKPGCFNVFSPISGLYINSPQQKVQSVCIKILNERCVGIITPGKWTLPFSCFSPPHSSCQQAAIVVPNNGPPPRM